MRDVEATLRAARPEDASRISVLLEQLGWAVTPDKVVAELSASPTTEVGEAESSATTLSGVTAQPNCSSRTLMREASSGRAARSVASTSRILRVADRA